MAALDTGEIGLDVRVPARLGTAPADDVVEPTRRRVIVRCHLEQVCAPPRGAVRPGGLPVSAQHGQVAVVVGARLVPGAGPAAPAVGREVGAGAGLPFADRESDPGPDAAAPDRIYLAAAVDDLVVLEGVAP